MSTYLKSILDEFRNTIPDEIIYFDWKMDNDLYMVTIRTHYANFQMMHYIGSGDGPHYRIFMLDNGQFLPIKSSYHYGYEYNPETKSISDKIVYFSRL